jgi:hypothetical protein
VSLEIEGASGLDRDPRGSVCELPALGETYSIPLHTERGTTLPRSEEEALILGLWETQRRLAAAPTFGCRL